MSDFNQKEYQTVILAALLHDVGKMLHRGSHPGFSGKHFEASAKFVDEYIVGNETLFDKPLLRFLVAHHHSLKRDAVRDAYFTGLEPNTQNRIWQLLKLIKKADSYSCAERDQDQPRRVDSEKRIVLDSIFSLVRVENALNQKETLPFKVLHPFAAFPVKDNQEGLDVLISGFLGKVRALPVFTNFDDILTAWTTLLEAYTWSVPSDTRYEDSDISLYDHLRSSAALAACLYLRHIPSINQGTTTLESVNELMLVGGDYSGIQDYIFSITSREQSGISKRLRARSFFISAFCEATIHKILDALELPLVCNIFSAGGKFLLIAPYSSEIEKTLDTVKFEIETEIHKNSFNQFSFLMCHRNIERYRRWMKVSDFFKLADEMFHSLETEKTKKSKKALIDVKSGKWNPAAFVATDMYQSYAGNGDCPVCGRGPAVCEDRFMDNEAPSRCCVVCHRDKYAIGQALPKADFIAFGHGGPEEDAGSIRLFEGEAGIGKYHVDIMPKYAWKPGHYLVQYIGSGNAIPAGAASGSTRRYIANHVPIDGNGKVLTFEDLAKKSRRTVNDKTTGSELLGVLKADVDNLGLIFSKGFSKQVGTGKCRYPEDRRTMSRFLTLSRMTELFFSGWVKEVMERGDMDQVTSDLATLKGINAKSLNNYLKVAGMDFRDIYTVYSGGDDMLLVGPWETIIIFALYLNQQFRKFTSANRDITLSAGLAFVKPKFPIAAAVRQADELLEKSKSAGKNRITLFGTTVQWEQMPELVEFFLKIDARLKDDKSKVKNAFLHRLLEYHRHALEFMDDNKVEGLRYLSMLSYDMGRNFLSKDVGKQQSEDYKLFESLIIMPPKENHLMRNLKTPLFWVLLGNR